MQKIKEIKLNPKKGINKAMWFRCQTATYALLFPIACLLNKNSLYSQDAPAASAEIGLPIICNYAPGEYGASAQNVYAYHRFEAGSYKQIRKMILMK